MVFQHAYTRLQFYDGLRNFFIGSMLPLAEVIFMYVFIKGFQTGAIEKTILAITLKSSFLIALPVSLFFFRRKIPAARVAALLTAIGALALVLSAYVVSLPVSIVTIFLFIVLVVFMVFPLHGLHPILADIYSLYPRKKRAKRFASTFMAFLLGSVVFSFLYDRLPRLFSSSPAAHDESDFLLDYPWVASVAAIALLISALCAWQLPVNSKSIKKRSYTLKYFMFILGQDTFFLTTLISWMFLGFANLWLVGYRTNFLVEDRFGFALEQSMVIVLLVIVPRVVQVAFSLPVGYLYDSMNVMLFRIITNVFNLLYMFFFFFAENLLMLSIGMVFFGIARAGGGISWKLWLNNMVPASKVGAYMSIHSAFTGFRMFAAPLFGLFALYSLGPKLCGSISMFLVIVSIIILLPLLRFSKQRFRF